MTYDGPERRATAQAELNELRDATAVLSAQVEGLTGTLSEINKLNERQHALDEQMASKASKAEVISNQREVTAVIDTRTQRTRRLIAAVTVVLLGAMISALAAGLAYTRSTQDAAYENCLVTNKNRLLFRDYMAERAKGGDAAAVTILAHYKLLDCSTYR